MKITAKAWAVYRKQLAAVNRKAADLMIQYVQENGLDNVDDLIQYAYALSTKYGEASAALACQMYDQTAEAAKAGVPRAEPADTATYSETAAAVNGTLKQSSLPESIGSSVGRLVKQAASDTTLKNARRDHAEFAWIPSGDGCPFCQMIAANGWRPATKETAAGNHAEHIHPNCECEFAVRFSRDDDVSGYDPQKYKDKYDAAEGRTAKEKLRSLEREHYAENKDAINARKRDNYRRNHEKSLNEPLQFNYNGNISFIPNHTVILNSHVIAGTDSKTELRVADKLAEKYHNQPEDWNKLVGKIESDKYVFDIHWYEDKNGVMHEPKIKYMKDKNI